MAVHVAAAVSEELFGPVSSVQPSVGKLIFGRMSAAGGIDLGRRASASASWRDARNGDSYKPRSLLQPEHLVELALALRTARVELGDVLGLRLWRPVLGAVEPIE